MCMVAASHDNRGAALAEGVWELQLLGYEIPLSSIHNITIYGDPATQHSTATR